MERVGMFALQISYAEFPRTVNQIIRSRVTPCPGGYRLAIAVTAAHLHPARFATQREVKRRAWLGRKAMQSPVRSRSDRTTRARQPLLRQRRGQGPLCPGDGRNLRTIRR